MTKAILVIDVDDVSRYHADVYKDDDKGNGDLIMNYLPFKLMPEKKYEVDLKDGMSPTEQILIQSGWNGCLDELLGETE